MRIAPTIKSFYHGLNVTIRRLLSAFVCISIGIAIGIFIVTHAPSTGIPPSSTLGDHAVGNGDLPTQLAQIETVLQAERTSHQTARERADEAERQAKTERIARESAEEKERQAEQQAKTERMTRESAEEKERQLESAFAEESTRRKSAQASIADLTTALQKEEARTAQLEAYLRDARTKITESLPPPPSSRYGYIRVYFYDEPRGWNRIEWAALQRMRREHHPGP